MSENEKCHMTVYTNPATEVGPQENLEKGEPVVFATTGFLPAVRSRLPPPPSERSVDRLKKYRENRRFAGGHSPLTFESDRTLRVSSGGIRGELTRLAVRETTGVGSFTVMESAHPPWVCHATDNMTRTYPGIAPQPNR